MRATRVVARGGLAARPVRIAAVGCRHRSPQGAAPTASSSRSPCPAVSWRITAKGIGARSRSSSVGGGVAGSSLHPGLQLPPRLATFRSHRPRRRTHRQTVPGEVAESRAPGHQLCGVDGRGGGDARSRPHGARESLEGHRKGKSAMYDAIAQAMRPGTATNRSLGAPDTCPPAYSGDSGPHGEPGQEPRAQDAATHPPGLPRRGRPAHVSGIPVAVSQQAPAAMREGRLNMCLADHSSHLTFPQVRARFEPAPGPAGGKRRVGQAAAPSRAPGALPESVPPPRAQPGSQGLFAPAHVLPRHRRCAQAGRVWGPAGE